MRPNTGALRANSKNISAPTRADHRLPALLGGPAGCYRRSARPSRCLLLSLLCADRSCPRLQLCGFVGTTSGSKECSVVFERDRDLRMIRPERFFPDRQRPLVERLGLGVAALVVVEERQVVEGRGEGRMDGLEFLNRSLQDANFPKVSKPRVAWRRANRNLAAGREAAILIRPRKRSLPWLFCSPDSCLPGSLSRSFALPLCFT